MKLPCGCEINCATHASAEKLLEALRETQSHLRRLHYALDTASLKETVAAAIRSAEGREGEETK